MTGSSSTRCALYDHYIELERLSRSSSRLLISHSASYTPKYCYSEVSTEASDRDVRAPRHSNVTSTLVVIHLAYMCAEIAMRRSSHHTTICIPSFN